MTKKQIKNKEDLKEVLRKSQDDKRYECFKEYCNLEFAKDEEYQAQYFYNGKYWEFIKIKKLTSLVVDFFVDIGIPHNYSHAERLAGYIIDRMPSMKKPNLDFIAFNNGVINRKTGEFLPHSKDYFLRACTDIDYNLKRSETPNFNKWLDWVSKKDPIKRKSILAALYMILGNFYQWQLFLEITGEGGSGKSVFNEIALMISGEKNSASVNLKDLEKISTRTILLDKTFIFAPDQGRIKSDGAVLKGLTGEDMLLFEPKYAESFNAKVKAVFLITDNEPIIFTEHNGGVSRRRTLFLFADKVPDSIKDDKLTSKIKLELPDIIHLLIDTFKENPDEAKKLLEAQRDSKEAMAIKREVDHLLDFASYFETRQECRGLKVGRSSGQEATAIYSIYKIYCQLLDEQPIRQRNFMKFFKNALKQHNHKEPYKEKTAARITITNVYLKEEWESVRQQWINQA